MSCIVAGLIKIKGYTSKSGGTEIFFLIKIQWSTPDQKILIKWGLKFLINTWSKDFVGFAWTNSACFFILIAWLFVQISASPKILIYILFVNSGSIYDGQNLSIYPTEYCCIKTMLNRLIFNLNYTFTGGWVAGLMVNKANLSKAELAAGCC